VARLAGPAARPAGQSGLAARLYALAAGEVEPISGGTN